MSTAGSTAVAVVTGGESGIGRACVEILRERGSAVYVIDQAAENPICVQDEEALARLAERIRREHGGVHVLINSAGIVGTNRPFEEYSAADFQRLIDVNLLGTVAVCHAFAARLREGRGAVVNLSSQAGLVSLPDQSAYSASKGAVVALTRSLAVEWGQARGPRQRRRAGRRHHPHDGGIPPKRAAGRCGAQAGRTRADARGPGDRGGRCVPREPGRQRDHRRHARRRRRVDRG